MPVHACVISHFSRVQLFATPWTVACQAPLSMGILQARILGWLAMPSSSGSSRARDRTCICYISCIGRWVLDHYATWEARTSELLGRIHRGGGRQVKSLLSMNTSAQISSVTWVMQSHKLLLMKCGHTVKPLLCRVHLVEFACSWRWLLPRTRWEGVGWWALKITRNKITSGEATGKGRSPKEQVVEGEGPQSPPQGSRLLLSFSSKVP